MNSLVLVGALCAAFLLERVLHAVVYSIVYLTCKVTIDERFRGMSAMRVSTGIFGMMFSVVTVLISMLVQIFIFMVQWAVTIMVFLMFSLIIYITLQYATEILYEASMTYNKSLGPVLQIVFVWPFEILTWFYEQVIPLWNGLIWFSKKLPLEILLQTVTHNLGVVVEAMKSLGLLASSLTMSLISWCQSFYCCSPGESVGCNNRCFDTGERVFDFLTPMAHLRNCIAWVVKWLGAMCNILSGPVDLVTFPIMDINFAKFFHFFSNSIIFTVFHVPAVTYERCMKYRAEGAIMCVPDFDPVFFMVTSSFHYLGLCVDNWLDILILIIEGTLGRPTPECTTVPSLLRDFNFRETTFGSRKTVIVGMTEHMFVRTDGRGAQYFSLDKDWQTIIHPEAFPMDVNLAFGVAPITHFSDADHDTKGDDTTSLLGCTCSATSQGVEILCGVAMFTDAVSESDRTIPVAFQLDTTAQITQCNRLSIRVEPIRWPVSRFTATRVQRVDGSFQQDVGCATKKTCLQVIYNFL
jgi:hypothetical protein